MRRLAKLFKVHPGEERTVALLLTLMFIAWSGFAIGGNAIESLFFTRFGPRNLPVMYIAVGLITIPATLVLGSRLTRASARRVLVLLPLAMALCVLALRGLLFVDARWVYPPLWLAMMVLWIVLSIDTWALAGMVHDTRQAKRLFPLYGASVILGTAVGGLLTAPLAHWLHAENLVLVWAASLVATGLLAGYVASGRSRRKRLSGPRPKAPGMLEAAREGYRFVRASTLLRWMSVGAAMLTILYYTLSLPFAKTVTVRYPDPDSLAGFLGLFTGITYAAALLVSLLVANRLFAKLGVPTMVLGLPIIYLVGFLALALVPGFQSIVGLRFAQLVWLNGVWLTGWQALRGVVPPERREQVRAFMDGGLAQVGVVLAGLILLVTQELLSTTQFYLVAAGIALAAAVAGWKVRRSYSGSLVDALRAGWPEVFIPEEEPFGGFAVDRAAYAVLAQAASDPDPLTRTIAMEILAELPGAAAADPPPDNFDHEDPGVRLAALQLAGRSRKRTVVRSALGLLDDPEPEVRASAADVAALWGEWDDEVAARLRRLLADPSVATRVRAAAALVRLGDPSKARTTLAKAALSPVPEARAAAISALTELALEPDLHVAGLDDEDPAVRRAAARGLPAFGSAVAADPLLSALADEDPTVRDAVADALVSLGDEIAGRLTQYLDDHKREATALAALVRLPTADPRVLRSYAMTEQERALHYHGLWRAMSPVSDDRVQLLGAGLRHRALRHAEHAVHALAPLGDHASVDMALQDLASRDPNQRANALETLEALSEPALVRPLLPIWEPVPATKPADGVVVRSMLAEDDPWIRACAAFAAGAFTDAGLREALRPLARQDPDPTVREAARRTLSEDGPVETRATLSLMDRMMALQKVELFRELSPADLKHVAEATSENVYVDGTVIAEQDEPGDDMHVVVSGQVRVILGRQGRADEVARRGPGYILDEMSILDEQPRMANLVAKGDVRTLSIDRKRFQRILRERPDAALAVMRELSAKLREAHAERPARL
ncbi:MAG: HEAT repeat domain-containing protein [Actinobacteria bacterium]|nr:HEAT repeat domain-containing protein [Actinomycetota bacterium]